MEKKNKLLLAAAAVVIIIAIIIAAAISSGNKKTDSAIDNSVQETTTEEPEVTPTFVYFMSQNDANYADAAAVVEKLKTEYGDRIKFDIRDFDADPANAENFAFVAGNTPALIMLDKHNAPCDFVLKNADEATLKASIEKALGD